MTTVESVWRQLCSRLQQSLLKGNQSLPNGIKDHATGGLSDDHLIKLLQWREFVLESPAGVQGCTGMSGGGSYQFALFFTPSTKTVVFCQALVTPGTELYPIPIIRERDTDNKFVHLHTVFLLISKGIFDLPQNPSARELYRHHLQNVDRFSILCK